MDTAHTDELIDDGPDADADASAFDRWLEETEARLDADDLTAVDKLLDELPLDELLDVLATRAPFPTVTVPVECSVCGADGEATVVVDANPAGRVLEHVVEILEVAFPGTEGTAWEGHDGHLLANCGHRDCR